MASCATPSTSLLAQPRTQSRARASNHMESISSSPVTAGLGPLACAAERQTQPSLVPAWAPGAELAIRNSHLRRCGYTSRRSAAASRRCAARASVATGTGAGEAEGKPSAPLLTRIADFQQAFWKFLRPHTIRGTVLGTSAVVAKALIENPQAINWALTPRALLGLLALLCGNGYIVGINQIYDTDIDKVNKPFLPVASGELSPTLAALLCAGLSLGGVGIVAANFGTLITALYCLGLLLGTLYSVPPFRLKRFALPAFLIIATVRGLLLNFGVYYATRAALALPFAWSPSILFITCFVTVFATVIAITKDLPDVEGDRKFKIETFATRLGVRAIAFAGAGLLLMNYFGAIVAAVRWPTAFRASLMISSHALLALALVFQTWKLDTAKYTQESIAAFYRFIWNLFYLEYCLLPFL